MLAIVDELLEELLLVTLTKEDCDCDELLFDELLESAVLLEELLEESEDSDDVLDELLDELLLETAVLLEELLDDEEELPASVDDDDEDEISCSSTPVSGLRM